MGFILLKMLKEGTAKVRLESYLVQKQKIRYSLVFSIRIAQIRYCLGLLLLNMQKHDVAKVTGVFYCSVSKIKVRLGVSSIGNFKIRYC